MRQQESNQSMLSIAANRSRFSAWTRRLIPDFRSLRPKRVDDCRATVTIAHCPGRELGMNVNCEKREGMRSFFPWERNFYFYYFSHEKKNVSLFLTVSRYRRNGFVCLISTTRQFNKIWLPTNEEVFTAHRTSNIWRENRNRIMEVNRKIWGRGWIMRCSIPGS